jgi:hypothetical protein
MIHMKNLFTFTLLGLLLAGVVVFQAGCLSALTSHPSPEAYAVQQGLASTNDSQAVAWLNVARSINASVTPSPLKEPVDLALFSLVTLASAAAGWLARHQTQRRDKSKLP